MFNKKQTPQGFVAINSMRNTLLILFLFLSCTSRNLKAPKYDRLKTDLEKEFINGKVESVQISRADFTSDSETEVPYFQSISKYNKSGYKNEFIQFDSFGIEASKLLILYKDDSLPLKQTTILLPENLNLRAEFHYDSLGQNIRTENFSNDTLSGFTTFKYDSNGKITEELITDIRNKENRKISIIYESNTNGSIKTKYVIDSSSNSMGKIDTTLYKNIYDTLGRLTESTIISKIINSKSENIYDKNGFIKAINSYKDGALYKETIYDTNKNVLQIKTHLGSSVKSFYYTNYKFDALDNWIERTANSEKNLFKEFRKINYIK